MNNAYKVIIHDKEYICITPKRHQEGRLFRITMDYKKPLFSSDRDNYLQFDKSTKIGEPYKIIGKLEPITEWESSLEKENISYSEFHSIKWLYFRAKAE